MTQCGRGEGEPRGQTEALERTTPGAQGTEKQDLRGVRGRREGREQEKADFQKQALPQLQEWRCQTRS